ncbi:ABC transporter permease [Oceanirhabdus sp. W0125-5]|uniref:ABC transporter permease n=1 Tax=Oceanirhabdus sp. W0125-5 TaxID=2999116 RepID=UPI0022F2F596|nr:ABC transporter permease [Oceanirhabdus sp. W0125-5]WBW94896.1 ABC transporter permease [Oceanirhabdus sp. W0125-5]
MKRFIRQSLFSFKSLFGYLSPKTYLLMKIIDPMLQMIYFSLLIKFVYKTNDMTPWIIGNAFILCCRNTVFGIGTSLIGERYSGTLKLIIGSPANKFKVFMSRGIFHIIDSAITVTIGLITGYLIFNFYIPIDRLMIFILSVLVCMFSAVGLGLCISVFGLLTRDIHLFLNTISMLLFALTGAIFPLERLPLFLSKIAYLLPITRSIECARLIASGGELSRILRLMGGEMLIGIIFIVFGYVVLNIVEKISINKATLDIY